MRIRYAYIRNFDPAKPEDLSKRYPDSDLVWAEVEFDASGKGAIIEAGDVYIKTAIEKALRTPAEYTEGEIIDGCLASKRYIAQPGTPKHAELMALGTPLLHTAIFIMSRDGTKAVQQR